MSIYDGVRADSPSANLLSAQVTVRRGPFTLDLSLTARPGEVIAVLGPNGSGKSTLLGALAGLIPVAEGSVIVDGRAITQGGAALPPERRGVGLMGQDPLLFPHLTALENIAFGPRAQGVPAARARAEAADWLARLGIGDLGARKPAQLSGGQRQRVALARALAAHPRLLLLDEPLGALDAVTAPEIRQVLRTHIRAVGVTTLLVTHDVLDAAMLADTVIVLADGRLVDSGPVAQVLAAPRTRFTAALAGLNLITGVTVVPTAAGSVAVLGVAGQGQVSISGIAAEELPGPGPATAVFAPSAVAVYLAPPAGGSPRNSWPAVVTSLQPGPSAIRVWARIGASGGEGDGGPAGAGPGVAIVADLTAAAVAELGLQPGSAVHLTVKATEVRIHPS